MPAYKDAKRGTWFVRFRYTDWTGRRIETTKRGFATKREAKEYEESVKREKESSPEMTIGELLNIYMADMAHRIKASSLQTKRNIYNVHVLPYFGNTPVNTITPAAIRKWQTETLSRGLSNTYLKTVQTNLSALFNYAVRYYNLPRNPVSVAGSIGKKLASEMDYWTVDEFNQFIQCEDKPMYRSAYLALFWCGLRCGELMALTGNDIDIEKRTISITKTYTRLTGRKDSITSPKTPGSKRVVSAPSVVIDAIKEYTDRIYDYDKNARIWQIHSKSLRDRMYHIADYAGVKKIRIHDLRHSHASYLINNNVPVKLISQRLGHENVETTLRTYAHMYKDTEESVSDMIESDSKKMWSK